MPYIQSKNHTLNLSEQEANFLQILANKINNRYRPAQLEYTAKDLVDYYYENEEIVIKSIKHFLDYFDPACSRDWLANFAENAGYNVTKYLSVNTNGTYSLANTSNTLFNILFSCHFLLIPNFKSVCKKHLKDMSVFTPITKVITDRRILSLIYPKGYDKETVYSFLNMYSFRWEDNLKDIQGIGPVSIAKIKQSLEAFGYPLIIGNMSGFNKIDSLSLRKLETILLSNTEDLLNAGLDNYDVSLLQGTKYINNRKLNTKETPLRQGEQKQESKDINQSSGKTFKDKYLDVYKSLPPRILKKYLEEIFKNDLDLLIEQGKSNPQLLLDYKDCIPFDIYNGEQYINEVLSFIKVQPKLIRCLSNKMIKILATNKEKTLKAIIYSDLLSKGEQDSLNAYVNRTLDEVYAEIINKGLKSKTKNR